MGGRGVGGRGVGGYMRRGRTCGRRVCRDGDRVRRG